MKLPFNFLGLITVALFAAFFCVCCNKMNMMDASARAIEEKTFVNPLAIPATLDATSTALSAQSGTATLGSGIMVNALGYGGAAILGPTLRISQGEILNLSFTNNLSEATNIHWHGLEAPADQDGYPTDVTQPGGSFQYSFTLKNRPGTYWYHPHPDMATASQAYRGLAGFFLVSSTEEEALNLPAGDFDIPLVVQDKRLGAGLTYDPDADDQTIGLFGETVIVNGTAGPVLDVATRTYRFRLLNGSNARIYNFALSNGMSFYLIGTDGGLIGAPVELSSLLLSPGERADILVDFSNQVVGSTLFLQSNPFSGTPAQGTQSFNILKFNVALEETDNFTLPSTLMPVNLIPAANAVKTRSFDIGHMMHHNHGSGMITHPIGGKIFDAGRIDEVVYAGTTEIWEFDNTTGTETHPMHLHGVQFQVLSRSGGRGAVQPWETGWKDTVLAFPGEKVRIIASFPDNKGKFVFHCHNLEHEDAGMMLNFEIR